MADRDWTRAERLGAGPFRNGATGYRDRRSTLTRLTAQTGEMVGQPRVGDPAPDFTLPGWYDGEEGMFTLSAERGHPVVLAFYPRDGGAVCTQQLTSYSDELAALTASGARIWAISPQDIASKATFAGRYGIKLPLLADTGGQVAVRYGLADPAAADGAAGTGDVRGTGGAAGARGGSGIGAPRRATFVVDAGGTIAWAHMGTAGSQRFRSAAELAAVLDSLRGGQNSGRP